MGWESFGRRVHGHDLGYTWLALELTSRVALAVGFVLIRLITPRVRSIWAIDAHEYAYPHHDDMISTKMMGVYLVISAGFLPPPLLALWHLKKWSPRQAADDALIFFLGLSGGLLLTLAWIELGKRTISRYRPDFLSRCTGLTSEADLSAVVASMTGLMEFPCGPNVDYHSQLLTDGRMSWPSGHTGTSSCVYVFLCCWFYLRLSPYNRLGFWKFAMPLAIALFPIFVGITRILDHRHHWTDVLSGGIVGCVMGFLAFRFYYRLEFPPIFAAETAHLRGKPSMLDNGGPPEKPVHTTIAVDPYETAHTATNSGSPQ